MIHGDGGIAEKLAARKYPFPIMYGPEPLERADFTTAIVFERSPDESDTIGAAPGFKRNARKYSARMLAAQCTIYAKYTGRSATNAEHEFLAEQLVDAVVTSIEDWTTEGKTIVEWGEMRYLRPDEIERLHEQWAGRAYRVRFKIGRGVFKRTFLDEAQPTAPVSRFANRTEARYAGSDPEAPPTIGCGGEEDTPTGGTEVEEVRGVIVGMSRDPSSSGNTFVLNGGGGTFLTDYPALIDGVPYEQGDHVLLAGSFASNGSTLVPQFDGVYLISAIGGDFDTPTFVRVSTRDEAAELEALGSVHAAEGTTFGGSTWNHTTTPPITLNTTPLVFSQA
jgi:hypothetical protein